MTSSSAWRLYVIVDRVAAKDRDLVQLTEQAIHGGADVIQLRDKTASSQQLAEEAKRLLRVTRAARVPLIINDRVDVAVTVGAEGVHLGQEDLPISLARQRLASDRLIGKSTHTLEQAIAADLDGADYIAVGPIFPTPTKPESPSVGPALISEVRARVSKPLVVIGGVEEATLVDILIAGAECIAVVRAVCDAVDPEAAARMLKGTIVQFIRTSRQASL